MQQKKVASASSGPKEWYYAAPRCQAAALFLTARRLHGLNKACPDEAQNRAGRFAAVERTRTTWSNAEVLGRALGVKSLGRFKDAGLLFLPLGPEGKEN